MQNLTFKKQLILGLIIVAVSVICSSIFHQSIISNVAWIIYGLLFLIHPVFPEGANVGKRGKLCMQLVSVLIILLALGTRFVV